MPFGVFEAGIQTTELTKIHLTLFHWKQFFVNPKTRFRDDANNVPQMRGSMEFNTVAVRSTTHSGDGIVP